ncbi:hypothetical protein ACH50O_09080 [Methylomonas sp. 2BW1-5-20]|uniref:hypothetical protein n=1 Tax=Methylomonas sp. 2BW1-5-20 TaxID=3376686 RepID=UPI00404ED97F
MNETVNSWLSKSKDELDDIYRNATPGEIPTGDTCGTAILAGSSFAKLVALLARWLAWQGKVFDLFCPNGQAGILVNKITPFSLKFIVAKVYRDKSWLDGNDTIVIDYSRTSFLARTIRDEIREIEPGVYLGKVWLGKKRVLDFALTRNTTQ